MIYNENVFKRNTSEGGKTMLNQRRQQLLSLLQTADDFQTLDYLASQCGVSKRTIHSDLDALEETLEIEGSIIERKRGVGVYLKKKTKETIVSLDSTASESYDIVTRRISIMQSLLFEHQSVSYNTLSNIYYVSKSSIIKDLSHIEKILGRDNRLKLESDKKGTRFVGKEIDYQNAHLQFNKYIFANSRIILDESNSQKIELLFPYYGTEIVKVCQNTFYSYIRENINVISDHYVDNILNIFISLIFRLSRNHYHIIEEVVKLSKDMVANDAAKSLVEKACMRLNLTYTEADILFLSYHLVSNRFESLPKTPQTNSMTNKLITEVSEALNINFYSDERLVNQISEHIPAMVQRLRSNSSIENPFAEQIKIEFALIFNVIWICLARYETELKIQFDENEISYLTMYFQAAIERARITKRILVVCQMGIATSELLVNRLKNHLPSLDTVEISSIAELAILDKSIYDLIITTVPLSIEHDRVVHVSPFLTEGDIQKIKKAGYEPNNIGIQQANVRLSELKKYVSQDSVFFNARFRSKEEVFKSVGGWLIDEGIVVREFAENLINRESLGGTDLPFGVAIPHGNPKNVHKTCIVVIKNDKKMKWDKYHVDIIFLICIAQKDVLETRKILSDIYQIIDQPQVLKNLRTEKTKESLLKLLRG